MKKKNIKEITIVTLLLFGLLAVVFIPSKWAAGKIVDLVNYAPRASRQKILNIKEWNTKRKLEKAEKAEKIKIERSLKKKKKEEAQAEKQRIKKKKLEEKRIEREELKLEKEEKIAEKKDAQRLALVRKTEEQDKKNRQARTEKEKKQSLEKLERLVKKIVFILFKKTLLEYWTAKKEHTESLELKSEMKKRQDAAEQAYKQRLARQKEIEKSRLAAERIEAQRRAEEKLLQKIAAEEKARAKRLAEKKEKKRLQKKLIQAKAETEKKRLSNIKTNKITQTKLIDSMEDLELWSLANEEHTIGRMGLFRGISGKGIALFYSLSDNGWVSADRAISADWEGFVGLRFSYLGTGSLNTMEILITDVSGNVFGKQLKSRPTKGAGWELVVVGFSELTCLSAEDKKMNISEIRKIQFKITKEKTDQGGKGRVVIDNLELVK